MISTPSSSSSSSSPFSSSSSSSYESEYELELREYFNTLSYTSIGAWCISAIVKCINIKEFNIALNNIIKDNLKIKLGMDKMIDLFISTCMAIPSFFRADVLFILLQALSLQSDKSLIFLQQYLFRKNWNIEKGATQHTRSILKCLLSDLAHTESFSTLLDLSFSTLALIDDHNSENNTDIRLNSSLNNRLNSSSVRSNLSTGASVRVRIGGGGGGKIHREDSIENSLIASFTSNTQQSQIIDGQFNNQFNGQSITVNQNNIIINNHNNGTGNTLIIQRKLFIQKLLRENFNFDENGLKIIRAALNVLATDIYTEDTHFVMELVQNADDNKYFENVFPSLLIILTNNEIIVHNNEVGFEEENMAAVCTIGESTKKVSQCVG